MNKNLSTTHWLHSWLAHTARQPIYIPICLLAITLAGTFLRIYKLGEWSFWGDEMFTVSGEEDGFNYNLFRNSLSLALIQAVTAVHGLNEWNARIVPAVIGVITIPVLFFVARKLFDVHTALLSAGLLALSPWHLYWSQNARFYTALLLFYSLALLYFYLGTEYDKPQYLLVCLIFLGLATKERLLALFFVPVILVYMLLIHILSFEKPTGWNYRNLAIFVIPGLFGGLLFAGPYLMNLSGWFSGFGFANNNPFWLASGFAYYVGFPVICVGSVAGWYLVMQKKRIGLLLCVSAVVPLLLLSAIAPFHYTANRYAFISLTSWIMLAAAGFTTLIKEVRQPVKLLAFGTLLVLLVSSIGEDFLYYFEQNGNRDNWKAAFAYVEQHMEPDDVVASGYPAIANYYLSTQAIAFDQIDLDGIAVQDRRMWFVEDMVGPLQYPKLHDWLAQNTQLVSVHDVNFQARNFSMRVYLYDPGTNSGTGRLEDEK